MKVFQMLLSCVLTLNCFVGNVCAKEYSQKGSEYFTYEGDESNSAPYVVVASFWEEDRPYKSICTDWRCDIDAPNTYYNVHNWVNYEGQYQNVQSGSGYTGFQNINGKHVIIFSLWGNEKGIPNVEFSQKDAYVDTFQGEGTGMKVITPYDWKVNTWYSLKVQAGTEGGYTYYDLLVKESGKDWKIIATIRFPEPNLGFPYDLSFLEDWTYNGYKRGHSLRNITVTRQSGETIQAEQVYVYHYNSKSFKEEKNKSLKCTYSCPEKGVISIVSSGQKLTNSQQFPNWVVF